MLEASNSMITFPVINGKVTSRSSTLDDTDTAVQAGSNR